MDRLAHPASGGQDTDPPDPPEPRTRAATLKLSPEEAQRVRVATRKVASSSGGFVALAVKLGVSTSIVYHSANPKRRPSLAFAVRLAAQPRSCPRGGRHSADGALIGWISSRETTPLGSCLAGQRS